MSNGINRDLARTSAEYRRKAQGISNLVGAEVTDYVMSVLKHVSVGRRVINKLACVELHARVLKT